MPPRPRVPPLAPLVLLLAFARPSSAGVNAWSTNGPVGGTVTSFAFDPATAATVYAGTNGAGLTSIRVR